MRGDPADAEQHARHERDPVERVVPDREGLPLVTEQHLLVGHEAAHADRVDRDAVDVGAAGAVEALHRGVGLGAEPRGAAGLGDEARGVARRARGGVDLARVVQLDDLDRLEVRRRHRGEPHHEHRADAEVGGDEHTGPGRRHEPAAQPGEPLVVEAGRADHGVDPLGDEELEVAHHGAGVGEVDHDLGTGRRSARRGRRPGRAPPRARGRAPRSPRGPPPRPCDRPSRAPPRGRSCDSPSGDGGREVAVGVERPDHGEGRRRLAAARRRSRGRRRS